jgi:hypothetical protein
VVGPSPGSGEAEAPPRSRSSLSSKVEVESEARVMRGGDHRLRPRLSPSPRVRRGGVRCLPEPRPSPSPGVGRGGVRCLPGSRLSPSPGSGEAEFVVFRGRGRVRALGRARRSSSSEAKTGGRALVSVFRDRGVPGPTSKMSPRAPAHMGRRETEHEGGNKGGRQAKGETRGLRVVLRPGRVRLQ